MNPHSLRSALLCGAVFFGVVALASCDNVQDLTANSVTAKTYTWSDVYPIFARSCMPCHNSGNKPNFTDSNAVNASAHQISEAVSSGWMPTAGTVHFTPAEKQILLRWADTTAKRVPQKQGD